MFRFIKNFILSLAHLDDMIGRLGKTNKIVDEFFKNPKAEDFSDFGHHTVKFKGVEVWIANRLYASPRIYEYYESSGDYCLPRIDTTIKFFEVYDKTKLNFIINKTKDKKGV